MTIDSIAGMRANPALPASRVAVRDDFGNLIFVAGVWLDNQLYMAKLGDPDFELLAEMFGLKPATERVKIIRIDDTNGGSTQNNNRAIAR